MGGLRADRSGSVALSTKALDEVDRRQKKSDKKNSFMSSGIGGVLEEDDSDIGSKGLRGN